MLVYAYDQGGVTESGLVATVVLIPSALLAPVVASLAQRIALGTSLFVAYGAQAATNGIVAVALFAEAPKLVVYALLVGPAIAFTMTRPIQSAFTPSLARTPEELTATNVVSGWIESASIFVAPALTGLVLAIGSEAMAFALVGAACLVGAVFVAPLRGLGDTTHATHDDAEDSFAGSLRFVGGDPQARLLLLLLSAEGIAIGALDVLIVELAQGGLGLGEGWVGYFTAAFGAGGILAVGVTARLVGLARLAPPLVASLAVWSVAFLGLAAIPGAACGVGAARRGRRCPVDVRRGGTNAPAACRASRPARACLRSSRRPADGHTCRRLSARPAARVDRRATARLRLHRRAASHLRSRGGSEAARHRPACDGSGRGDLPAALDAALRAAAAADAGIPRTFPRADGGAGGGRRHPPGRPRRSLLRHRGRRGRHRARRAPRGDPRPGRGIRGDRPHVRRASYRHGHHAHGCTALRARRATCSSSP